MGLILFWFWDQILCEKPTCGDRFQILFISCKTQPGASKMVPKCSQKGRKWSQKGPTWSQQGPKWSQKGPTLTKRAPLVTKMLPKGAKMEPEGPNLAQNGAEREPKNIDKFTPGPDAVRRGACWPWKCLRVSFQHAPFPAVNLLFAIFFFFPRRIPSWIPPFPSLVGRVLVTPGRTFGCFRVVVFSVCFCGVLFDDF